MARISECLVMAKPAGPSCNMRCSYCYYLEKSSLFPDLSSRMSEALLEKYIIQRIQGSSSPNTHFEWHGGEPTLLGIDFFRTITRIQRESSRPGKTITNGLQTNGLLLDDDWADFLAQEKFSVGFSMDGPAEFHDAYRKTPKGGPTHERVVHAFQVLKKHHVFCNVLCVITETNSLEPDKVYGFFLELGVQYLQFLPLVLLKKDRSLHPLTANPEVIGDFLIRVFDLWIRQDVGKIVVQNFDEALRPIFGIPHALCVHRETCGNVAVLEHNGDFFTCDHFVDPEHLIGNLQELSLESLVTDRMLTRFGMDKQETLPRYCKDCEVLGSCNGGCPKDRISQAPDRENGLNYLCPAYKRFFKHSKPQLTRLAAHMRAGKPLRSFKISG